MQATGFNSVSSWVVVAVSSVVIALIQMPHRVASLWFVSFVDRYGTDRQSASLPSTLYSTLKSGGAPLAAYLAEIIGIRSVIIIGCFVSSLGVGACYFAENITDVTVSLGLVYGVGLFMGNSLMPQVLKMYFNANLANAHGFALAGACIGALIHPPGIKILMEEYGLSGTFLIVSGIMLNGIPIAMLLRDPKYGSASTKKSHKREEGHIKTLGEVSQSRNDHMMVLSNKEPLHQTYFLQGHRYDDISDIRSRTKNSHKIEEGDVKTHGEMSEANDDHLVVPSNKEPLHQAYLLQYHQYNDSLDDISDIRSRTKNFLKGEEEDSNTFGHISPSSNDRLVALTNKELLHQTHLLQDPHYKDSLDDDISDIQSRTCLVVDPKRDYTPVDSSIVISSSLQLPAGKGTRKDQPKQEVRSSGGNLAGKLGRAFRTFLVFRDPPFLVIMLCFSLHLYIVLIVWVIMIDVSRDKGIDNSLEVYYLVLLPVAEIIGNCGLGWLTDCGYMSKANYTGLCFVFLGLSCSMFVWASSFVAMLLTVVCFGIFTDATGITAPGLVYQFLDESKHTMAIAARYVIYTPLSFTTAPLIGYFRGLHGSYDGILYLLMSISFVSGGLVASLPYIAKCSKPSTRTPNSVEEQ